MMPNLSLSTSTTMVENLMANAAKLGVSFPAWQYYVTFFHCVLNCLVSSELSRETQNIYIFERTNEGARLGLGFANQQEAH